MKRPIDRIRRDFENKYGPGYATSEILNAAHSSGRRPNSDVIKDYASKNDLGIDLKSTDIDLTGSNVRFLIPRSNLGTLIEGLEMGGTVEELVERLERSREIASSNPNQRNRAGKSRGFKKYY